MWSSVSIPGRPTYLVVDASRNAGGWEAAFCDRFVSSMRRRKLLMCTPSPVCVERPAELTPYITQQETFNAILLFCHGQGEHTVPGTNLPPPSTLILPLNLDWTSPIFLNMVGFVGTLDSRGSSNTRRSYIPMNIPRLPGVKALITLAPLALSQVAGEPTTDTGAAVKVQSIWDFMVKGGPMMYPLGLCSLIALTVIVERMISMRRRKVIPRDFLPGLNRQMENHATDYAQALAYCQNNGSPIANIFAAAIKRLKGPLEIIEKHIQEAGQREVRKLRKFLRSLSVIASIAPLMGLLGTIFGMIIAFQTVATSGGALGKAELLAKGIYQAMITTAAGLMLAIPVLIAYHWFSAKIDRLVSEMDELTFNFIEEHTEHHLIHDSIRPKLQEIESETDREEDEKKVEAAIA